MVLYIVRHGQTNWNKENLFQGSQNIPLNNKGIEQAEFLANELKDINIDYIFSSSLSRAIDTAKIINKYHDINIEINDKIIERNLGDLEGKSMSEYANLDFWNTILNLDHPNKTLYNIENLSSLINRAHDFLSKLISKYENTDKNILIVSHGGILLIMLLLLGAIDTSIPLYKNQIKNCECYKFINPVLKSPNIFLKNNNPNL